MDDFARFMRHELGIQEMIGTLGLSGKLVNTQEVKAVYIRLQKNKCAYCERQLTGLDHGGAIEHDLEHYRPKGHVPAWPPVTGTASLTFPFPTRKDSFIQLFRNLILQNTRSDAARISLRSV